MIYESYSFVIDTDSYAGNFERELSEHITGLNWEWVWEGSPTFGDLIEPRNVEEDDYRIDAIQDIQGPECHSVGIFLSRRPNDDEIKRLIELASSYKAKDKFGEDSFKIIGFRLLKKVCTIEEYWEDLRRE